MTPMRERSERRKDRKKCNQTNSGHEKAAALIQDTALHCYYVASQGLSAARWAVQKDSQTLRCVLCHGVARKSASHLDAVLSLDASRPASSPRDSTLTVQASQPREVPGALGLAEVALLPLHNKVVQSCLLHVCA